MSMVYDPVSRSWNISNVLDANFGTFNNFLAWGQPYNPRQAGFDTELYESFTGIPTVSISSAEVMTGGFGTKIDHSYFDIFEKARAANVADGVYSMHQLQQMVKGIDLGRYGDHKIGLSLYSQAGKIGVAAGYSLKDAMYVFGSVRFELVNNTTFTYKGGHLRSVSGNIKLENDKFKHQSGALLTWQSAIVAALAADEVNFDVADIIYTGNGVFKQTLVGQCFPAWAPISISSGASRFMSDLRVGDIVLAFDPSAELGRGALVPRRVTRLFRNVTTEWLRLTWQEAGEQRELITTPGHHFLDQFGAFPMPAA